MIHGSPQPSQQEPSTGTELSRKDLCRGLLSNGVNLLDKHGKLTVFVNVRRNNVICTKINEEKMKQNKAIRFPKVYRQEACC